MLLWIIGLALVLLVFWCHLRISTLQKRLDVLGYALDRFSEANPELFPYPEFTPSDPKYWQRRSALEAKLREKG
jgi:hypothetical protein